MGIEMNIEGVFTGVKLEYEVEDAVVYTGTGPADEQDFWLVEYTPVNQRHLDDHIRRAERLPTLSPLCPSLPTYHFTLTYQTRFYLAMRPLPPSKLTPRLPLPHLILIFTQLAHDLTLFRTHVSHIFRASYTEISTPAISISMGIKRYLDLFGCRNGRYRRKIGNIRKRNMKMIGKHWRFHLLVYLLAEILKKLRKIRIWNCRLKRKI